MTKVKMLAISCLLTLLSLNVELKGGHESKEVLESLHHGNKKFVENKKFIAERKELVKGQNPHCVVLSCSDSRVPPELVFDQGLGKLFVARLAGNVADNVAIDSIEYAVTHYDVSVLVVLGHTECGAVIGALDHLRANKGVIDVGGSGHLDAVLIPIETAIIEAGIDIYGSDALERSIHANIHYVVGQLLVQSPLIATAVAEGKVKIVGAEYSLKTGKVKELLVRK